MFSVQTLFAIGSNSKHFAALAIGTLIENSTNELQWTSKIANILPEWGLADPLASQQANIQDILSHRSSSRPAAEHNPLNLIVLQLLATNNHVYNREPHC